MCRVRRGNRESAPGDGSSIRGRISLRVLCFDGLFGGIKQSTSISRDSVRCAVWTEERRKENCDTRDGAVISTVISTTKPLHFSLLFLPFLPPQTHLADTQSPAPRPSPASSRSLLPAVWPLVSHHLLYNHNRPHQKPQEAFDILSAALPSGSTNPAQNKAPTTKPRPSSTPSPPRPSGPRLAVLCSVPPLLPRLFRLSFM